MKQMTVKMNEKNNSSRKTYNIQNITQGGRITTFALFY